MLSFWVLVAYQVYIVQDYADFMDNYMPPERSLADVDAIREWRSIGCPSGHHLAELPLPESTTEFECGKCGCVKLPPQPHILGCQRCAWHLCRRCARFD